MATSNDARDTQVAGDEEALIQAHLAALAWIEAHLLEPMTVKSVADHTGYSASRFSRGFTRLQGESVMSYVRGRRLEAAMRRILTEPDIRIIDLAFDSGFDSQEAFTRAFAKAFGHPPARLRSLGPVSSMMRRKKASTLEPEIHERVELMPDLHLAAANAAYVNYIGDEGRDGVRAAYGEHKLLRLAALKAKFDPRNLFRMIRTSSPQRADHSGAHGLSGESHSGLTAARCWDRTSS